MGQLHQFGQQMRELAGGLMGLPDRDREQRNIDFIRLLYQLTNEDREDEVVELVTEDFELIDVPSGTVLRGRDGFAGWLKGAKIGMPDGRTEISTVYATGDVVIAEAVGRGTHTGQLTFPGFDPIPPTGRTVETYACEVYEVRDGMLAKNRVYYDAATFARQLGITA